MFVDRCHWLVISIFMQGVFDSIHFRILCQLSKQRAQIKVTKEAA